MLLSFGDVATLTVQTLAAIFSIILYVFLSAAVFPPIFLKPKYRFSAEGDRGVKRYAFSGGRAIVYEPSAPYRKYMTQYILSANGKEKYIKCKFKGFVYHAIYDVVAFDSADRVLDTVRVKEELEGGIDPISGAALLPPETAYAKVVVRAVNETPVPCEKLFSVPASAIVGFMSCVTVAMVAEMLFLRFVIESYANILFAYSQYATGFGYLFALISAVVMGLILSGLLIYLYHSTEKIKKIKKKKK